MSSVLGGFAITFFATVLVFTDSSRAARIAIAASSLAAGLFIAAVGASVDIVISTHPEAPLSVQAKSLGWSRWVSVLSFSGAIFLLSIAIGASGWMRSRSIGIVTSLSAFLSLFLFVSSLMVSRTA
ncbi:MAG: hypothetical protein AB3N06_08850 [Erythrobacter sp.]